MITRVGQHRFDVIGILAALEEMTVTPEEAANIRAKVDERIVEPEFLTVTVGATSLKVGDRIVSTAPTTINGATFAGTMFTRFTVERPNPKWKP